MIPTEISSYKSAPLLRLVRLLGTRTYVVTVAAKAAGGGTKAGQS